MWSLTFGQTPIVRCLHRTINRLGLQLGAAPASSKTARFQSAQPPRKAADPWPATFRLRLCRRSKCAGADSAWNQRGTVPENALIKQHKALLETEGVEVEFTEGAIDEIATISFLMNEQTENIGARRLHTIMEKLLEDISFNIPDMDVEKFVIDAEYVKEKFIEKIHPEDLDQYIL